MLGGTDYENLASTEASHEEMLPMWRRVLRHSPAVFAAIVLCLSAINTHLGGIFIALVVAFLYAAGLFVRKREDRVHPVVVRLITILRWFFVAWATALLIVVITNAIGAPSHNAYPMSCRSEDSQKCTRIGAEPQNRADEVNGFVRNFTAPIAEVYKRTRDYVSSPLSTRIKREDDNAYLWAIAHTSLMAFADDVMIRFRCIDGQVTLDAQSEARLGKIDFGVNTKRIQDLVDFWNAQHWPDANAECQPISA
ncbi:MAG: hypothetical protein MHM6MM_007203 [Cercozoa sp. M6MM]